MNQTTTRKKDLTMKKTLLLAAVAFIAMQAIPAHAEEGAPKGKPHHFDMFTMQDTNKDGVVTQDEFLAFNKARFAENDADHDGKVTKEEVQAHREQMKEKWQAKRKEMKDAKPAGTPPAAAPPAAGQ
jgi:hypothetical protein